MDCAELWRTLRDNRAVRQALSEAPRHVPPAELREQLLALAAGATPAERAARRWVGRRSLRWATVGAAALALALAAFAAAERLGRQRAETENADLGQRHRESGPVEIIDEGGCKEQTEDFPAAGIGNRRPVRWCSLRIQTGSR
jgi:hypothetical protein